MPDLSSSRSTPTRAITSSMLSSRSSPTLPSAATAYDPLVKAVLAHRLAYNIFSYSALFSWILTLFWTTWDQEDAGLGSFVWNMLSPSIWLLSAVNWALGVLPVVLLRKFYLTAKPSTASSPSKTLQIALSKPTTLRALLTYVTSAILVTLTHIFAAYFENNDPHLRVFVRSRKHPYYLNGRFVFLVGTQVTLALVFLLRNIMLDRLAFRATTHSKSPFSGAHLLKTAMTVTTLTLFGFTFACLGFGLARTLALPLLLRLPLVHQLLRPFTAHFPRGAWTLWLPIRHAILVARAFCLGWSTVAGWEHAEGLFDLFIAQPILVSERTADPALTLIAGLTSADDCFRHHAYAELRHFASEDTPAASARRTALFGDQKYNPSLWSALAREALLLLGTDYQLFLRRGAPAPAAPTPAAPPPAAKLPQTPHTPLIKKPIFRSSSASAAAAQSASPASPLAAVLDSFASDSKLSRAVGETAEGMHMPDLFRSVSSLQHLVMPLRAPPNTPAKGVPAAAAPEAPVAGLGLGLVVQARGKGRALVGLYVPAWLGGAPGWGRAWWRGERLGKIVEASLPRRDMDVLAIEVLAQLTCASLTEDRYGVVQRDIPRILEAFLSFLSAIEAYQMEIKAAHVPPSKEELAGLSGLELETRLRAGVEVAKAGEALGFVSDALKDGVAMIVRTFGDKLLAFKFPPRTARKLQGFIDYN
ncbi:hypothetical protein FIBSPDRAFT_918061 [Athelia psychrophila]|uniref:Nucleoporin protein Ndc1-Nup n=1 Tax=Athelia psychrophila TaxID=1759441 RepID=A0A166Q624_9AGAM|nr:hypothetical protein FIBSPDRAFT_918061 [Fibularhizoctonia sp. CBS 109695]